jgi:hypothetical protein
MSFNIKKQKYISIIYYYFYFLMPYFYINVTYICFYAFIMNAL